MIKTPKKLHICERTFFKTNNFFEAAINENLPKKIQIWTKICADKVINVIQLLIQSDGESCCYC